MPGVIDEAPGISGRLYPDALHLAIAHYHACSEFWTNDKRLSKAADTIAINILEANK